MGQSGHLIHLSLARIQSHDYATVRECGICSLFSGQEEEEKQFWLEMISFVIFIVSNLKSLGYH